MDRDTIRATVRLTRNVPATEYSLPFIQGMIDRMSTSYFKYGRVPDAFPDKVDAVKSLKNRLDLYERDGNVEWLIDAANFAMIEFMYPKHSDAHFEATTAEQSNGRVWNGEIDPSKRSNKEF